MSVYELNEQKKRRTFRISKNIENKIKLNYN